MKAESSEGGESHWEGLPGTPPTKVVASPKESDLWPLTLPAAPVQAHALSTRPEWESDPFPQHLA